MNLKNFLRKRINLIVHPDILETYLRNSELSLHEKSKGVSQNVAKIINQNKNVYFVDGMDFIPKGFPTPSFFNEVYISGGLRNICCEAVKNHLENKGYKVKINEDACL